MVLRIFKRKGKTLSSVPGDFIALTQVLFRVHPVQTASLPCVSCSTMAKGNKRKAAQSKTITLKVAKECLQLTLDGKLRLNLSFKGVSVMPKCLPKLCEVEEVDLSRNLIGKIPDFIDYFISLRLLDLHSNYVSATIHRKVRKVKIMVVM